MEESKYTRKDRKPSSVYISSIYKVITASADYYILFEIHTNGTKGHQRVEKVVA